MSPLVRRLIIFLSIRCALCTPDLIVLRDDKQSGSSLSGDAQGKISEHVIFDDEKQSKEVNSVFDKEQLGINERKHDEKRYEEQDTARKGYDKGRQSLGESKIIDQKKNSFEGHGSGYYKKGHRRTGFSKNYHKDESGNNSSFYEDSDDEGGHRSSDNSGGFYGQRLRDSFKDGVRDVFYGERDKAEQGTYDNRRHLNDYNDYARGYNNDRLKNDIRNYLRDEAGRYFDRNGNDVYYRRERFDPTIYRNNDYYADKLHRRYYKDDPYVIPYRRDYRYFPRRLGDYEERNYPYRGYYDRNRWGHEYVNKFRNGFDNVYDRF